MVVQERDVTAKEDNSLAVVIGAALEVMVDVEQHLQTHHKKPSGLADETHHSHAPV